MFAEPQTAILVFARAPVAGHAKTRLIPLLGAERAARVHARMALRTLIAAHDAAVGPIELWYTPSMPHPFFIDCERRFGIALHAQVGASLGERLAHAHDRVFERHARALMIGTDCPLLTAAHLRTAAQALRDHDAVLTPAEDGGYVLLGLRRPCPQVFVDIDWSTEQVFRQTMTRLQQSHRSCHVSETLWDVDLPRDFERLAAIDPEFARLNDPDGSCRAL